MTEPPRLPTSSPSSLSIDTPIEQDLDIWSAAARERLGRLAGVYGLDEHGKPVHLRSTLAHIVHTQDTPENGLVDAWTDARDSLTQCLHELELSDGSNSVLETTQHDAAALNAWQHFGWENRRVLIAAMQATRDDAARVRHDMGATQTALKNLLDLVVEAGPPAVGAATFSATLTAGLVLFPPGWGVGLLAVTGGVLGAGVTGEFMGGLREWRDEAWRTGDMFKIDFSRIETAAMQESNKGARNFALMLGRREQGARWSSEVASLATRGTSFAPLARWTLETPTGKITEAGVSSVVNALAIMPARYAAYVLWAVPGEAVPVLGASDLVIGAGGSAMGNLGGQAVAKLNSPAARKVVGIGVDVALATAETGVRAAVRGEPFIESVGDGIQQAGHALGKRQMSTLIQGQIRAGRGDAPSDMALRPTARVPEKSATERFFDHLTELQSYLRASRNTQGQTLQALGVQQGAKERLSAIKADIEAMRKENKGRLPAEAQVTDELLKQLGTDPTGMVARLKQSDGHTVATTMRGVAPRTRAALVVAAAGTPGAPDTASASEVKRMSAVAEDVARTNRGPERARAALTQAEIDARVLQTFGAALAARGRDHRELASMSVAPMRDARGQRLGDTGREVWAHIRRVHPEVQNKPQQAGELYRHVPAFEHVRRLVEDAGGTLAQAKRTYAGVLVRAYTGDMAAMMARAGVRVDHSALLRQSALRQDDAAALERVQREALSLHARWHERFEKPERLSAQQQAQFIADVTKTRGLADAVKALPNEIRWQMQHHEMQQEWREAVSAAVSHTSPKANLSQVFQALSGSAMQRRMLQAQALGFGSAFTASARREAARLGMVFEPDGERFRPLRPSDGMAHDEFARRVARNEGLRNAFLATHPRATWNDADVVRWVHEQPASMHLMERVRQAVGE